MLGPPYTYGSVKKVQKIIPTKKLNVCPNSGWPLVYVNVGATNKLISNLPEWFPIFFSKGDGRALISC